jgi:peptide/nickel transport system substrate-binding protein
VFFDVIVGAKDYADGKANTISGIKTDDNTGDITIELTEPNGTFENVLGLMFAAPVPPSTPLDKDATNSPPPSSGPFMISKVEAPRTRRWSATRTSRRRTPGPTKWPDAGVTRSPSREQEHQRPGHRHRAEQGRPVDPPASDRLQEVKTARQPLPPRGLDHLLLLHERSRRSTIPGVPSDQLRVDPEALNGTRRRLHPTQQILPPGMPATCEYKLYPGPDMNKANN